MRKSKGRKSIPDPSRVRIRDGTKKYVARINYPQRRVPPGVNTYVDFEDTEYVETFEHMRDTRGYLQNWQNPCWHATYWQTCEGLSPVRDSLGNIVIEFPLNEIVPKLYPLVLDVMPTPDAQSIDDLSAWTDEKLVEAIDPAVDLFNFIRELVEMIMECVKSLLDAIRASKGFMDKFLAALQHALDKVKHTIPSKDWNNWVVLWGRLSPAQKFLIWSFVIAPFLQDLREILTGYKKAAKRLVWLRTHNGKPTYSRVGRKHVWDPPDAEPIDVPFPSFGRALEENVHGGALAQTVSTRVYILRKDYTLKYVAQGFVRFDIPSGLLDGMPGALRVLAHTYGLDNPVGIIWEATKMSWLVDWFLSFRSRVFERLLHCGPPDAKILEQGYSFKCETAYDVFQVRTIQGLNDPSINSEVTTKLGEAVLTVYFRMRGKLNSEAYYFRLPWSWQQITLLWAVIEQRIWRRLGRRKG